MSAKGFAGVLAHHVGSHIRELRLQQGLTQPELAARMGLPAGYKTHVNRLESGKHLASLELISAAAYALGLEVSELLGCLDGVRPGQLVREAAE